MTARALSGASYLREEGNEMEVKTFAATLGVGMLTGAAVMMMIPKQSSVYKAADDAAMTVKRSMTHAMDAMKQ